VSFREYLREQLDEYLEKIRVEQTLNRKDFNKTHKDEKDPTIACINFAYANQRVVNTLLQRGKALIKGNAKAVQQSERVLVEVIRDSFSDIQRPVMAYVTFEYQYGFDVINYQYEQIKAKARWATPFKIGSLQVDIDPADEVENIKWENVAVSKGSKIRRTIIV
jgi:hypothetical protein